MTDEDFGALEAGAAYALLAHQVDRLVDRDTAAPVEVHVDVAPTEPPDPPYVDRTRLPGWEPLADWELFVGQERLKRQLLTAVKSAKARNAALPHILLASGWPGVGKTTMARLLAAEMGRGLKVMAPPFGREHLVQAARGLPHQGVLLIDEIHMLPGRAADNLLHLMEEGRIYTDYEIVKLNDITVIGTTTEPDALPEPVLDRFTLRPYFEPYSSEEMNEITMGFALQIDPEERYLPCPPDVNDLNATFAGYLGQTIGGAARRTPRVARQMVVAARDLAIELGRMPLAHELLNHVGIEKDGLERNHVAYLTTLYRLFRRPSAEGTVYLAGEHALRSQLRETQEGLLRLERYLMERGLVDRTPQGRRLTERGIRRVRKLIELGRA